MESLQTALTWLFEFLMNYGIGTMLVVWVTLKFEDAFKKKPFPRYREDIRAFPCS